MPYHDCPRCFVKTGRHLTASSENSSVNYYRCDSCGHVWAIEKDARKAKPHDVTITTKKIS